MPFNSLQFVWFFPIVIALYFATPHRHRWILLLVASYYFYMSWRVEYALLIMASTLVVYFTSIGIEEAASERRKKLLLGVNVVFNLGLLFTFKYFNFVSSSLQQAFDYLRLDLHLPLLNVLLPVGISFYTFQITSYSIDVYRGEKEAERHLGIFALFVCFFPQLVAGPIERSGDLLPQFYRQYDFDYVRVTDGLMQMFWGLFKKVVIADRLAAVVDHVYAAPHGFGGFSLLLASVFFPFQVYCDFSGYSDMARGIARLFGIRIANNFRLPYLAPNPMALWQRWHRTLAFWFRDYVYGPLSRSLGPGTGRAAAALATMGLVGLWHGAAWTYVLWGFGWGVVLVVHRLVRGPIARFVRRHPRAAPWRTVLGTALTFYLWLTLGTFFVAPDAAIALRFLWHFHTGFDTSPGAWRDLATVLYYSSPLVAMQIAQFRAGRIDLVPELPAPARFAIYAGLTFLLLVMGAEADQEFFYFAF